MYKFIIIFIIIFIICFVFNNKENFNYNDKIVYVCYSHSEYYDILNVHSDYLKNINDIYKILLVDKIVPEHNDLTQTFDKIIYYDNNINYTKRLYNSLMKIKNDELFINTKYVLFTQEKDILINMDNTKINEIIDIMNTDKIDRIVLITWHNNCDHKINNIEFSKSNDSFTVNPSIWNLQSFIKLNENFDLIYSDSELPAVHEYCRQNVSFFYLCVNNDKILRISIKPCSYIYVVIHITTQGKIIQLPTVENPTEDEQKYLRIYEDILKNYTFKEERY